MKKIPILLFVLFIFNCQSDDDNTPRVDKTALFLEETTPQFTGKLEDYNISWSFGFSQYQMSSAFNYPNGESSPERYLRFALTQENGDNQLILFSPVFDSSSIASFNSVFGLGEKQIGNLLENYRLSIRKDGITYEACDLENLFKIEVIKTEEVLSDDASGNKLKVWYKLEPINFSECDPNFDNSLSESFILAQFIGYEF